MSASGATAGIHHVTRTTDRDVPRPDMVTARRQPAAALTVGLIDAARRAMLTTSSPARLTTCSVTYARSSPSGRVYDDRQECSVTGVTGRQGEAVADHLLAAGWFTTRRRSDAWRERASWGWK